MRDVSFHFLLRATDVNKLLAAIILLGLPACALAEDGFSLSGGLNYSTGKYGNTVATTIWYLPVTAEYRKGKATFDLTVPYISVTGPGGVIPGFGRAYASGTSGTGGAGGSGGPGQGTGGKVTNAGLGDIIASAGYTFYTTDALEIELVGRVKFGTADPNKGLGTGQNDYMGEFDFTYILGQGATFMPVLGYKKVGAPPGVTTHDVPYGNFTVDQEMSETTHAGVMYAIEKSPAAGIEDQREAMVYVGEKLSPATELRLHVLKGFTTSTPDFGAGVTVSHDF